MSGIMAFTVTQSRYFIYKYNIMSLPQPSQLAQQHSETLLKQIQTVIADSGGEISFAEFMQLALYAPAAGYYSGGLEKFGVGGDFTTAPEISPLFSQCVAEQCAQVLAELGHADILEVGAGSGIMAANILLTLDSRQQLPDRYYILELSAELRQRQAETIKLHCPQCFERVQWLDALPLSGFRGVVLGNELIDAMPVQRFIIEAGQVREQTVISHDGELRLASREADSSLVAAVRKIEAELGEDFTDGYESEINAAAEAWLQSVSELLESGLVLLIDYGYTRREFYHQQRNTGTLMCHYQHRAHPDAMILIGLQDITAHVDFTALAEVAANNDLSVAGYTTQAHFLLSMGIEQRVAKITDSNQQIKMTQQIKQLVLPSEMGELFKVIALTRNLALPLQGFTFQDQRSRL